MENLFKLLFIIVGALLLVLAITSYTRTEAQMKNYQETAYQKSRQTTDDWVQVGDLKNEVSEATQDRHTSQDGLILIREYSGMEIIKFLSGHNEDDPIEIQYSGDLYRVGEIIDVIGQIQEDESYLIEVKPDFCYEIKVYSEE